jgi:hypothetical protein
MNIATYVHLASEQLNSTSCIQRHIAITDLNMVLMSTVKPVLNGPFIKWKTGFSGKTFWTLQIPFRTGFTVLCNVDRLTPSKQFFPDKKLSTGAISGTGVLSVPTRSEGDSRPMSSLSTLVTSTG